MKSCFFIGHRDAPESIVPDLTKAIECLLVESNATDFIVGNYGRFDTLVQKIIATAKEKYPYIALTVSSRNKEGNCTTRFRPNLISGGDGKCF